MTWPTFFKSERSTRAEGRSARAKAIETAQKAAYRLVDARDGLICRVCGRRVKKTLTLAVDRLEHHHVNGRGRIEDEAPENICVVCKGCHDDRHVKRTLHLSGNANKRLRCEQDGKVWFSEVKR